MVQLDQQHNQQQTLALPNMEVLVVQVINKVPVAVAQVTLEKVEVEDHQEMVDGVVQEFKHHHHSEIQVQDMVELSLEEIHLEMIGDLLVVAAVVVTNQMNHPIIQEEVLMMVHKYLVDHTMVVVTDQTYLHEQLHQVL